MALQHLRSSTADKRHTPAAMSDGQLALNTHTSSPGLFFKDSNGDSVKIGPLHVGTTAPNATPGAGGQAGNSKGEQWLDTSSSRYVFKIWDGTAWRTQDGEFVNTSGDTMTGALVMDNQQQVQFRETTANGTNSIALQAPAAVASDKTITLPDATGTLVLSGTIVNADINASAAIVDTKLATIATAGKVSNSATTATDANTASAIVARSAAGNFNITSINNGPLAGMRNAIINGNFDIWQRGTSFASPTSGDYTADRWDVQFNNQGATRTLSRQSFALGQTDVPGEPTYFMRFAQSVAGSGGSFTQLDQHIESVRTFAGQQVTISFWAKAAASTTMPSVVLQQRFGTGGSPSSLTSTTAGSSLALTTAWQKFSYQVTLPSISGKTLGTDNNDALIAAFFMPLNATFTIDIAQVQVEPGPVATPFERRPIGTELALCQRYYAIVNTYMAGYTAGAFSNSYSLQLATQMRAVPTVTVVATTNTNTTGASVVDDGNSHVRHVSTGVAAGGFISSAAATLSAEL